METISAAVVSIATANALAPNRRQGICCANADLSLIFSRFLRGLRGVYSKIYGIKESNHKSVTQVQLDI